MPNLNIVASTGIVLMAVGLGTCAAPIGTYPSMLAFGLTGLGFLLSVTCLSTLLQKRMPPVLRGRVMALWLMGFIGARPACLIPAAGQPARASPQ